MVTKKYNPAQTDIFSPALQTEQAIKRAEENANDEWKRCCQLCLHQLCLDVPSFTADDLSERMERQFPGVETHDKRAAGAVMRTAARNGWCKKSGQYDTCKRANQHSCPKTEWLSLLYSPSQ